MSKKRRIENTNIPNELYRLSCELRGLSELFAHQTFSDPANDIDECLAGVGFILRDMGERLRLLYVESDDEACKRQMR